MGLAQMGEMWYTTRVFNRKIDHGATLIARGLATTFQGGSYMIHSTPQPSALKVCSKCGESKPHSEFHKGKDNDGLRHTCKACVNAQNRSIYEQNKDAHLEAKRRYRRENPEARRATLRKYEQVHRHKRHAHYAIKHEIRDGRMPSASECQCAHCGNSAETYHHWSYEREHWLDVTPLCRECHGREHRTQ